MNILCGQLLRDCCCSLPTRLKPTYLRTQCTYRLVSGRNPMMHNRKGLFGIGMVDSFFDAFLPYFMHALRTINFGKDYADAHHEEVVSKDGISRPKTKTKVLPAPQY